MIQKKYLTMRIWKWLVIVLVLLVLCISIKLIFWKNITKDPSIDVRQRVQFQSIEAGLRAFRREFGEYPSSSATDPGGQPYCGAMKLCEAIVGRDLMGFHKDSVFRADGMDASGTVQLYGDLTDIKHLSQTRRGPMVSPATVSPTKLSDVYGIENTGPYPNDAVVCCDIYKSVSQTAHNDGMPVLYFIANGIVNTRDPNGLDKIYNPEDNRTLIELGVPDNPKEIHPLYSDQTPFINQLKIRLKSKYPGGRYHVAYILLSAGPDGLYGTEDDDMFVKTLKQKRPGYE